MQHPDSVSSDFVSETNRAIHTIVAHLQRYKSEMEMLKDAISTIKEFYQDIKTSRPAMRQASDGLTEGDRNLEYCFSQINLQISGVAIAIQELSNKTDTLLALVSSRV
jgi:methyl-accepting chemotaxis protein